MDPSTMSYSPPHDHSGHTGAQGMLDCDGNPLPHGGGTWMGHVMPGIAFCLWGSWWAYNVVAAALFQTSRRPYRSRTWYPMAVRGLWALEPVLKLLVPPAAISTELLLDHNMQFQHLYCQAGTKLAGAFDSGNMNNWQHTASCALAFLVYGMGNQDPGVILSGITDFVGLVVPLPPGASQAILGVGWSVMTFLMALHEKHEPLDKMVHWLLFVAMATVTLMLWLDLALRRRSVLAGLGRALAVVFQGAWLVQIGVIGFEGHPQWRTDPPFSGDLAATMAPVAFTSILLTCLAALLALYCAVALGKQAGLAPARLGLALDAPDEAEEGLGKLVSDGLHGHNRHQHDSAHHTDDSEDNDGLLDSAGRGGSMAPFHIAAGAHGGKDGASYV